MPDRPRVLVAEAVHAGLEALGDGVAVEAGRELSTDRPALLAAVAGCAGLVVRNQTLVDAELLSRASDLRVVGRLGAGLDNLDLGCLGRRGVVVVHGGGLNARAVAEYVVGAVLDLARHLSRSDREVRRGHWVRRAGVELQGSVLGVVGLGRTGLETARLARALGMVTIGYDPFVTGEVPGIERAGLADLLRASQVLSLHVPLSGETRGLLGAAELALLPPGALVVNAARGGIVDEEALCEALVSGHLGGAALDVRPTEPPPADDPLARLDNVVLTAHQAGLTTQSQRAIASSVLGDVARVLAGAPPEGPAITPA
ncbi:MAG TPA: NAD(P)-dependent oxidoreductase [Acidimicrobiales bacterium]|nr:NAD(P)-dependent oxidoreductase [Acidimicrobiales bacterium]